MSLNVETIEWLEPWSAVSPDDAAQLEQALVRALGPGHVLQARAAKAVARRVDQGDVLFLVEGPAELAVVHLVPQQSTRSDAPATILFESAEAFSEGCLLPDHLEHTDTDDHDDGEGD